jgi:PAS domain S-box-containing protein
MVEAEPFLRALIRTIPDMVWLKDPAGVFLACNPAAAKFFNTPESAVPGKTEEDFFPVEAAELHRACDREASAGEDPVTHREWVVFRSDGRRALVETVRTPLRDSGGRLVGVLAGARDITAAGDAGDRFPGPRTPQDIADRARAEQELRAAHAELAVIYSHAPVVFLVVDEDLRVEKVNETAARFAGRPESEMLGLRPGGAIGCLNSLADPGGCGYGPACGTCVVRQAVLDTVRNGNRHDNIEAWLWVGTGPDVEHRCLLVFTAPLETHGKRKALVSVLDITCRKRAEEDLRTSEVRFRMLSEEAPIAISMARQGSIVYANPTYVRMFGFQSAEELYDYPLIELFAPQCRAEVTERANRRVQGLPVSKEYEAVCRRADGSEFPVLVAVSAMQFPEGPALVGFITDLTGPKQAEAERQLLEQQFRQSQKLESIGRLAGGVAHDFNNLLTIINGYSRMALDLVDERDPLRESLEAIHGAGERAVGLTNQLLAFSRKQILKPQVLDLNRVVSGMRPLLSRLLGEDVELCVELPEGHAIIRADLHQLEQVVMNLAVNSRDAMPQGGTLSIATAVVRWDESQARSHAGAQPGRYVSLAVSDTGEGMSEETRRHMFEPFFTTKEVGKGTGLGLSMVQGIVAQSGGHIEVHSEPGRGTTFRVYLPEVEEDAPEESGQPPSNPAIGGKATVLVVEDQPEVRKYAVAVLKARGYRVIEAESAGQALRTCERAGEPIDLVLTDVVMPQMGGGELASRLAERRPGIRVLFMSGYADDVIVRHGVLEQGAELIQKPFTPDQLTERVREILAGSRHAVRILVTDDDAAVRAFLRVVLEGGGYQVTEAADGKQALEAVRAGRVDLVITDLVMPEQEGIETIRTLRKEVPGMGIIAISGAFNGRFLRTARMLGADVALAKPVDPGLLLAGVAEALKPRP